MQQGGRSSAPDRGCWMSPNTSPAPTMAVGQALCLLSSAMGPESFGLWQWLGRITLPEGTGLWHLGRWEITS